MAHISIRGPLLSSPNPQHPSSSSLPPRHGGPATLPTDLLRPSSKDSSRRPSAAPAAHTLLPTPPPAPEANRSIHSRNPPLRFSPHFTSLFVSPLLFVLFSPATTGRAAAPSGICHKFAGSPPATSNYKVCPIILFPSCCSDRSTPNPIVRCIRI